MTPENTIYPNNVYGFCGCCVLIGAVYVSFSVRMNGALLIELPKSIPLSATLWIRTLMDVDTSFTSFREAWVPSVAYSLIILVYFGLGMAQYWPDHTGTPS